MHPSALAPPHPLAHPLPLLATLSRLRQVELTLIAPRDLDLAANQVAVRTAKGSPAHVHLDLEATLARLEAAGPVRAADRLRGRS